MALDHFVSQVHLRQFNSPALRGNKLHGIRKRDQFAFPCSSRDVCRVDKGSTNSYLVEPRAIEEFLKTVEPAYNEALAALRAGRPDRKAVHVIAGFTAYVALCSPTAIRLQTKPLEGTLDVTAELLERRGEIPPPPPEFGGASWSEVRASGAVKFDIDGKYPQAIGIGNVVRVAATLGNGDWEILLNPDAESNPFLTSDFPACLAPSADPRIMNRVVPLAPDVAVRIHPNIEADREKPDLTYAGHRFRLRSAGHQDVRAINALVVRCAEDLVFARDRPAWLPGFVRKHRDYRVDTLVDRLPTGDGTFIVSRARCVPYRRPN